MDGRESEVVAGTSQVGCQQGKEDRQGYPLELGWLKEGLVRENRGGAWVGVRFGRGTGLALRLKSPSFKAKLWKVYSRSKRQPDEAGKTLIRSAVISRCFLISGTSPKSC